MKDLYLKEKRKMRNRTKAKSLDLRYFIVGMIAFIVSLALLLTFSTLAQAVDITRTISVSTIEQFNRFKVQQDQSLERCKRREDHIALSTPLKLELVGTDGRTIKEEIISNWRCEKSPQAKREEERRRLEEDENRDFRIASDSTTECDRAILYDGQQGEGCRKAETVIKSVDDRNQAVEAFSGLGAAVVQATTAAKASNIDSQDAAFELQEQTLIAGIIGAGVDTGNSVWGAAQLSRAESDARRAASGIKSAQATYVDAENAAVSGERGYGNRLEKGGSLAQIEGQIRADYGKRIDTLKTQLQSQRDAQFSMGAAAPETLNVTTSSLESEIAALEADRDREIQKAHKAFANGISGSGIEETVRSNFGTFDNFRRNASKGIKESNAVAEQASAAGMNAKFRAVTGGLAMLTQVGQLQAIRRLRAGLQDVDPQAPPAPVVAIGGNPVTPTIPDIPPGPEREGSIDDFALDPLGDGIAPPRIEGSLGDGAKFAKGKFKPRQTQVSGAAGGGLTGGGGSGASRAPSSQRSSGPRSIDYAGGGGGLPGGGGGPVAGAAGDTDFQNAIRDLLGGEKEAGAEGADFDYYRKVASSRGGKADDEENGDPRSIFERVKTKYNDVVSRGVI